MFENEKGKRMKWKTGDPYHPDPERYPERLEYHFYASSAGEYRKDRDPEKLVRQMKKGRMFFSIWYVPVSIDYPYSIEYYAPQVDGAHCLCTYDPN